MLTQDEAELYDRQIRLWGVNAQSRIRQSKVLMLGFEGIASEVAKILVLAGINTLTIVDDKKLQTADLTSNLFCRPQPMTTATNPEQPTTTYRTHECIDKLKRLNPLVKVHIQNRPISSLQPEDFEGFDLVTLHSFMTIDQISLINKTTREKHIKFYLVLDYGFFGFMFNDLGSEFKFSYEVFDAIEPNNTDRQRGAENDPISIADDPKTMSDNRAGDVTDDNDYDDDVDEDDDDELDNRPKKKRRLHSPKRETISKSSEEKTTKIGTLSYVPFRDMISTKFHNCNNYTSPVLFTTMAILKFYTQFERLPGRADEPSTNDADIEKLHQIFDSILKDLNVSQNIVQKLNNNWTQLIHGSLSPICAVLGGVAGQDMIRALSNKDIPLHNTFLFDGMNMMGIVEKVGISINPEKSAKPIIRDFIEIDD